MRYAFYIGTCLLLIIIQTTLFTYFHFFSGMYNLLIPFVIFICVSLPARESLPFVIILGLVMDNLSGSPFGLYLTYYFWLFVGVRWILRFLRVSNKFLLALVVVAAVFIENIMIIATFALSMQSPQVPAYAFQYIIVQLLWALATGPLILFCLLALSKRFNIQLNGSTQQSQAYG